MRPPQQQEMARLQERLSDPRALVEALVKRGWLTSYQGSRLLQGQASTLLLGPYVILDSLGAILAGRAEPELQGAAKRLGLKPTTLDALRHVYGVGARKSHTTVRIVLPAAVSGIPFGYKRRIALARIDVPSFESWLGNRL